LQLFVFKDFRYCLRQEWLFNFASVWDITPQQEFFDAIPHGITHLEADRDHDRT